MRETDAVSDDMIPDELESHPYPTPAHDMNQPHLCMQNTVHIPNILPSTLIIHTVPYPHSPPSPVNTTRRPSSVVQYIASTLLLHYIDPTCPNTVTTNLHARAARADPNTTGQNQIRRKISTIPPQSLAKLARIARLALHNERNSPLPQSADPPF